MTQTFGTLRPEGASVSTPTSRSVVPTEQVTRALLGCGIVAGPLFLSVVVVEALTRPGFELARHPVSLLSLGEFGWIQMANFIASGLLVLVFAVGLRGVLSGSRGGTWGPLLIGGYGLGLIIAGVFVPDSAWGFPPGSPEGISSQMSWHSALHGVGFTLAFVSISAACFVFARRSLGLGERALTAYTVASAVIAIVLSQWPGMDGASVRYFVAAVIVWTWTVLLALRLRSAHGYRSSTEPEPVRICERG